MRLLSRSLLNLKLTLPSASYILGPLKSRLSREMGTNNTEFSLLISAFSLNSTWTPLVGGVLASHMGTTFTSILATGVIFLGMSVGTAFPTTAHSAGLLRVAQGKQHFSSETSRTVFESWRWECSYSVLG